LRGTMMVGFADETVVGGESVGARLRSAREAHGLSLDDIATRTRVPTRHLKAIEEDAFDQLPAAPYSVGFAKAFADAVGRNREEIGREFRAEKEGYGAADGGLSYVSDEPGASGNGGLIRMALILVIVVAIAFGLWKAGLFGGSSQVAAPAIPPPAAAPAAVPPAAPPAAAAPSEANASQGKEEGTSGTKSSSEQGEVKSEKRTRSDRGDEAGKGEAADKGAAARTESTPSGESEKPAGSPLTRELNLNAQKPATQAAPPAITPPPAATPPVIVPPPPPPPAATPAAPGPTP